MAVTQAGCDLTYCKMRGIVSVLTGTSLSIDLSYSDTNIQCLFGYALEKKNMSKNLIKQL